MQAAKIGGKIIADYGERKLLEVSTENLDALEILNPELVVRDEYNLIRFNTAAIDTTASAKEQPPAGEGQSLYLVQFAGPVKPEWYAALEATGVEIISYMPSNAYLVFGDSASLAAAAQLDGGIVQWHGQYKDDYKYDVDVKRLTQPVTLEQAETYFDKKAEAAKAGKGQENATAADLQLYAVQMVNNPATKTGTLATLNAAKTGAIKISYDVLKYTNVIVPLDPLGAKLLANRPDVVSVQLYVTPAKRDERQNQIIAGNTTGNVPNGGDWLAYLTSKGFDLTQVSPFSVDVTDSGVDNGTTSPNHFGLYKQGLTSSTSRVIYNRLEGTPHAGSTIAGKDGHGNLNTHIIGGYVPGGSPFDAFPHADASGFRYGMGVAPFVKTGSSVIFDPGIFTSPSYPNLASRAYNDGARISSNSWGANTSQYTADAQAYDALVRDAQPAGSAFATTGNQEMVFVFSAGNAGAGAGTIGSPGTGKNVITVGASENVQAFGGADNCGIGDTGADSLNDIISFSSRGPTADGRKKPDLVAPGTHVSGSVWQASRIQPPGAPANGAADASFDGTGVCGGLAPNNFFPAGQQWYSASSGTSHSTPATAGAAALIRQDFINKSMTPPSPALTKALLMATTRYMTGVSANDTLWSNNQGMGLVNLHGYFDTMAGSKLLVDQTQLFTASGQSQAYGGVVADSSKPTRITLAWTDQPGSVSANPSLVNNLDLEVTVGGNTYKGNVFSGSFSATGGSADTRNNVENVVIPAGVTGSIVVKVLATNIAGDGVPNNASPLDQDFALVVANVSMVPTPVITATNYQILARSCALPLTGFDPGETVTVGLTLQNVGTAAAANIVATLQATGGVTVPSGAQSYGALGIGSSAVRNFSFTAAGSCGSTVTSTFALTDGGNSIGNVTNANQTGVPVTIFTQNFDGVTAPALPADWSTSASGTAASVWVTTATTPDTAPNAAFVTDPANVNNSALDSPAIAITTATAKLSFRNFYDLESTFDGGVLEIKIGGGSFQDILAAGGSFSSGGYNATISSSFSSPIAGRQAWTGSSGSYINTVVNLPAAAAGQSIQLRFRMGSDTSVSKPGWRVDSISILDGFQCCTPPSGNPIISSVIQSKGPQSGGQYPFMLRVRNTGPGTAVGVRLTALVARRLAGSGNVSVASPLAPVVVGSIPPGGFIDVPVTLNRALTVTRVAVDVVSTFSSTAGTAMGNTQTLSFFP